MKRIIKLTVALLILMSALIILLQYLTLYKIYNRESAMWYSFMHNIAITTSTYFKNTINQYIYTIKHKYIKPKPIFMFIRPVINDNDDNVFFIDKQKININKLYLLYTPQYDILYSKPLMIDNKYYMVLYKRNAPIVAVIRLDILSNLLSGKIAPDISINFMIIEKISFTIISATKTITIGCKPSHNIIRLLERQYYKPVMKKDKVQIIMPINGTTFVIFAEVDNTFNPVYYAHKIAITSTIIFILILYVIINCFSIISNELNLLYSALKYEQYYIQTPKVLSEFVDVIKNIHECRYSLNKLVQKQHENMHYILYVLKPIIIELKIVINQLKKYNNLENVRAHQINSLNEIIKLLTKIQEMVEVILRK